MVNVLFDYLQIRLKLKRMKKRQNKTKNTKKISQKHTHHAQGHTSEEPSDYGLALNLERAMNSGFAFCIAVIRDLTHM